MMNLLTFWGLRDIKHGQHRCIVYFEDYNTKYPEVSEACLSFAVIKIIKYHFPLVSYLILPSGGSESGGVRQYM